MANFQFDQADGLRRILAGSKPRIVTFLFADTGEQKCTLLANLGASLARAGSTVVLLDACPAERGFTGRIAASLSATPAATLLQVARRESTLEDAVHILPQGFGIAALGDGSRSDFEQHGARLATAFRQLVEQNDIVMVDAELDDDDGYGDLLPLQAMADGEIVIQVSPDAASIQSAYSIIKRLNARLGRRPFSVLVTDASEQRAQTVYRNLEQTATRYLSLQLHSLGSVPPDEHLTRAARLGRTVIDAFPMAGASVAFRHIAGRFSSADARPGA